MNKPGHTLLFVTLMIMPMAFIMFVKVFGNK